MFNSVLSPTIHKPTTINDLNNIIFKNPDTILYSGGVHIMSKMISYPLKQWKNIVDLKNIDELKVFINTDYSVIVGAENSFSTINKTGDYYFDDYFLKALSSENMSDAVIQRATLSGAIACSSLNFYNSIIASLVHIGAKVTFNFYKRNKLDILTLPMDKFLKSQYFTNKILIRALEIPKKITLKNSVPLFSYYKELGNSMKDSKSSMAFIGTYGMLKNKSFIFNITVLYHDLGFFSVAENLNDNSLTNNISYKNINSFSIKIVEKIKQNFDKENKKISNERLFSTRLTIEDFIMRILEVN